MTAEKLRQHLLQWRMGRRDSASTELVPGGASAQMLPRSFRPHRIVPRVYLGALKDVQDMWALHRKLLSEELFLLVSTCDRNEPPRLELRQLFPPPPTPSTTTTTAAAAAAEEEEEEEKEEVFVKATCKCGGSCRVRRLAVCRWEELEAHVIGLSGRTAPPLRATMMAQWLQQVIASWRFSASDENKGKPCDKAASSGVVYLKLCLPWRDEPSFPVRRHFDVAVTLMRAVEGELGKAVVCYCIAGASRSVTLVCAFLLRCYYDECHKDGSSCSPDDAVRVVMDFVRSVRLCACPNDGFVRQLTEYAADISPVQ